jgi:ribose transport system ATP-binding protein
VRPGDVVGVAGITGSGRDVVLGAVFGALEREGGTVTVGGTVLTAFQPRSAMDAGVGFLPAERKIQGGIMEFSARENLTLSDLRPFWVRGLLRRSQETTETKSWFERLDVRPSGAYEVPLMNFSGGNQQKVLFGKWMRRNPRVFLLDEPTQGVDVGAKAALHRQILAAAANGAAVVISSSDVDELAALCHEVLVVRNGRIVARLRGDEVTVAAISHESLGSSQEAVGL